MHAVKKNQTYILIGLLFLVLIPNLIFVIFGEDSAVNTTIKQIVFLAFALALVLLPLILLKPKLYFLLLLFLLPFLFIDIYILLLTKTQSTSTLYATIFDTNFLESKELMYSNIGFIVFTLLYLILYIYLWINLKNDFTFVKKSKILLSLFSLGIISIIFIRDISLTLKSKRISTIANRSIDFFTLKLDKTYPLGSVNKIKNAVKGKQKLELFKENNKDFSYHLTIGSNENQTIVLVLGETARKHNFQLYGYNRKTNPILSKTNNLIIFKNATTNANLTLTSFSQIFSSIEPNNYEGHFFELGLVSAFNEADFHTYWITNQSYSPGSIFQMYSKQADLFIDVSMTLETRSYDEKIIPIIDEIIQDNFKKRLIVIHSIGSHFRYNFRYPKQFSKYLPELDGSMSIAGISVDYKELFVNSYDNSIIYTDYFLSKIIDLLKKNNEASLMMYLSDHGENLYDDDKEMILHGNLNPTKYELEIPMLIWYSDTYKNIYITKLQSVSNAKISSSIVFSTLSTLGGFKTKLHQEKHDLLSDSLISGNRYFLKADGSVINIDKN